MASAVGRSLVVGAMGGVVAGGIIVAAFFVASPRVPEVAPPTGPMVGLDAQSGDPIAALRLEIDVLKQALAEVKRVGALAAVAPIAPASSATGGAAVVRSDGAADLGNSAAETSSPIHDESSQDEQERIKAQIEAQVAHLEKTILAEEVDPSWAIGAETNLISAFKHDQLRDFGVEQVQCRSTACVVRLSLGSLDPAAGTDVLMHVGPWPGETTLRVSDDDPSRVLVYTAREGHSLPRLEQ